LFVIVILVLKLIAVPPALPVPPVPAPPIPKMKPLLINLTPFGNRFGTDKPGVPVLVE
jgi:hypothetical protein